MMDWSKPKARKSSRRFAVVSTVALLMAITFLSGPVAAADNCLKVASQGVVNYLKKSKGGGAYLQFLTKRTVHINDKKTNNALYYFSGAGFMDAPNDDIKGYIFSNFSDRIVSYVEEKGCKLISVKFHKAGS